MFRYSSSINNKIGKQLPVRGFCSDGFKKAAAAPLIKKASLSCDDMKSYHSVSGWCFISKLAEWVVAFQTIAYINPNGLDNQSPYKVGHWTETVLLSIKTGEGEALDQSVAFDTIDHSTLLSCLQTWFGISGTVLRWLWSYLIDHFQCIKIGSTLSELRFWYSLPQG